MESTLAALKAEADLSGVGCLAVAGTSGTILSLSDTGQPMREASLYNDRAPEAAVRAVAAAAPAGSAAGGAASPLAKLLAMQYVPGTARLSRQADWIAARLRAAFGVSDENNALKTGYDPVRRCWPGWLRDLGIRVALLPEVVEPATPIGTIDPALAARFGLPADVVVAAGITDGCAAFLATGADMVGEAVTSLGSTLTLKQLCDRPIFSPEKVVYSHRLGDRWLAGGASSSGGAALARYLTLDALVALSARIDPALESGLDYYPHPSHGERFPLPIFICPHGRRRAPRTKSVSCMVCLKALPGSRRLVTDILKILAGPPSRRCERWAPWRATPRGPSFAAERSTLI